MGKETWIPIHEARNDRIDMSGVNLPSYVRDRVGVNLERTERLMNIGGIRNLSVVSVGGERARAYPDIVGFDNAGQAIAGFSLAARESEKNMDLPVKERYLKGYQWCDLSVSINSDDIASRAVRSNVYSTNTWSKELDSQIRREVRETGVKFSLQSSFFNNFLDTLSASTLIGLPILFDLADNDPFMLIAWSAFVFQRIFVAELGLQQHQPSRHSLFLYKHLDRAAWLAIKTRTTKVVKPLVTE